MSANQTLSTHAKQIFSAGLAAVDPYQAVRARLFRKGDVLLVKTAEGAGELRYEKADFDQIVVVGGGKASAKMALAVEEVCGDWLKEGLVVVKTGHLAPTRVVELWEAAHPVPDLAGQRATEQLLAKVAACDARTLVIALISGGASALLAAPAGIDLQQKQALTQLLLAAGADIVEINTVRKHVSAIKGGQLARAAHPARLLTLLLSDVVGDRLDAIGSGPTVPDGSTFGEARAVLERYRIWHAVAPAVRARIEAGVAGEVAETPKAGSDVFAGCQNVIIGSNIIALQACEQKARELGYNTLILSSSIEGETRDVAGVHAAIAKELRQSGLPVRAPACIISGGETTVSLGDDYGRGGRNQEFALAAALQIAGMNGTAVVCGGSDGNDGPTDAAGAIAYGDTLARAEARGLNAARALDGHDAYPFFAALGDLLMTGPTGTNVMDMRLILVAS
jgi:glycerate 2-kinase